MSNVPLLQYNQNPTIFVIFLVINRKSEHAFCRIMSKEVEKKILMIKRAQKDSKNAKLFFTIIGKCANMIKVFK